MTGPIGLYVTVFLVILMSTFAFGQEKNAATAGDDIIRKGLFRAQGTISPGWDIADGKTNIYLQGDCEYYASRRVSIKGDIAYFLDTQGEGLLKQNHSLFFGAQYHFPVRRFDPYIGFHPGASVIQVEREVFLDGELDFPIGISKAKVAPAISMSAGFNYYVWKYVHFLANVKYIHAKHPTEWGTTYAFNEFRIAFGVGWNVNMVRK